MSHGPEHHIEHAEHAVHAIHDEFNKRVTMSIAIVAAVLACVTMLGHRSHNETLRLQGDALALQGESLMMQGKALEWQTKASIESTKAANKWAYYQTKNMFHLESSITVDLLKVLATKEESKEELQKMRKSYQNNVDKYEKKLPEILKEGQEIDKKSEEYMAKSQEVLQESQKKMQESEHKVEESHLEHKKAARLDYGELGLQFGVVLCSLAILTKSRGFWFGGILSSVIGAAVAMTGQFSLFLGGGHH